MNLNLWTCLRLMCGHRFWDDLDVQDNKILGYIHSLSLFIGFSFVVNPASAYNMKLCRCCISILETLLLYEYCINDGDACLCVSCYRYWCFTIIPYFHLPFFMDSQMIQVFSVSSKNSKRNCFQATFVSSIMQPSFNYGVARFYYILYNM